MKFNCGTNYKKYKNWHKHFAILPVKVGSKDCRWLETVWRKGEYRISIELNNGWDFEYKAIKP